MNDKKKLMFVCHKEVTSFLNDILHDLSKDYNVILRTDKEKAAEELESCDVVWFEWANDFTVEVMGHILSNEKTKKILDAKRTILRIHGYEVFAGMFKNIDYYYIDHILFVSDHVRRIANDFFEGWSQGKRPQILSNGVDVGKFEFQDIKEDSKNIAIIADVNPKKNTAMWLEAAHVLRKFDPEYTIHVAGYVQDIRCKVHLDQVIRDNQLGNTLRHVGRVDNISKWIREMKITHILSTSIFESFGYGIAEAMAMGVKPLIYNYPGACEIWPSEFVFSHLDEMIEIVKKPMDSSKYRNWIESKYSLDRQLKEVREFIEGKKRYKPPTISACMIVRDEEKDIKRCLDSINDLVDEIIVVDTGSKDKTKEIASEYKKVKLFDHEWKDDFSEARNVSLEKATCDWILIIDADEYLMEGDGYKVKKLIDNPEHTGYLFQVYSALEHGSASLMNSERFFKNGMETKYNSSVHNQISIGGKCCPTNVRLWHTGYANVDDRRKKRYENTLKLLNKEISKDTSSVFYHFNLARQYTVMRRNEEGRTQALHVIALLRGRKGFSFKGHPYTNIFHCLFVNCLSLEDYITPEPYLIDIMEEYPEYIDAHFCLSTLYSRRGEEKKALAACVNYLKLLNFHKKGQLGFAVEVFSVGYEAHIHHELGKMYELKGEDEKAKEQYVMTGKLSGSTVKFKDKVIYEHPVKKAS